MTSNKTEILNRHSNRRQTRGPRMNKWVLRVRLKGVLHSSLIASNIKTHTFVVLRCRLSRLLWVKNERFYEAVSDEE
jgi:hypothetical protein